MAMMMGSQLTLQAVKPTNMAIVTRLQPQLSANTISNRHSLGGWAPHGCARLSTISGPGITACTIWHLQFNLHYSAIIKVEQAICA